MITISETNNVPVPVRRAVRKLGADIRAARLRRRIPASIIADRSSMSVSTLRKIEQGGAGVSLGNYASVLFSLGLVDRLAEVADARSDVVGLTLEEERLPKRIRNSRSNMYKRREEP